MDAKIDPTELDRMIYVWIGMHKATNAPLDINRIIVPSTSELPPLDVIVGTPAVSSFQEAPCKITIFYINTGTPAKNMIHLSQYPIGQGQPSMLDVLSASNLPDHETITGDNSIPYALKWIPADLSTLDKIMQITNACWVNLVIFLQQDQAPF